MRSTCLLFVLGLLLSSCSYYHYYPAPVNAPAFANKMETQASASMGTHGFSTRGSYCLTKRMLFAAQYNTIPGYGGYFSREGETSTGFNLFNNGKKYLNLYAGYGFGNSHMQVPGTEIRKFEGHFDKPFTAISFNTATTTYKTIKADATLAIKTDYIFYKGSKLIYLNAEPGSKDFEARNFFWEFYTGGSFGGKYLRFDFGTGFAFKRLKEAGQGVRVFPVNMTMGLTVLLFRKYDQKEPGEEKKQGF